MQCVQLRNPPSMWRACLLRCPARKRAMGWCTNCNCPCHKWTLRSGKHGNWRNWLGDLHNRSSQNSKRGRSLEDSCSPHRKWKGWCTPSLEWRGCHLQRTIIHIDNSYLIYLIQRTSCWMSCRVDWNAWYTDGYMRVVRWYETYARCAKVWNLCVLCDSIKLMLVLRWYENDMRVVRGSLGSNMPRSHDFRYIPTLTGAVCDERADEDDGYNPSLLHLVATL